MPGGHMDKPGQSRTPVVKGWTCSQPPSLFQKRSPPDPQRGPADWFVLGSNLRASAACPRRSLRNCRHDKGLATNRPGVPNRARQRKGRNARPRNGCKARPRSSQDAVSQLGEQWRTDTAARKGDWVARPELRRAWRSGRRRLARPSPTMLRMVPVRTCHPSGTTWGGKRPRQNELIDFRCRERPPWRSRERS
jgi:hypothetical protein